MIASRRVQITVNRVHDPLEAGLLAELVTLGVGKIVIRIERRIQRRYQVEESLATDGVAQRTILVAWNTPATRGETNEKKIKNVNSTLNSK